MEFLLANHPLDCPICDQGGECDLQVITTSKQWMCFFVLFFVRFPHEKTDTQALLKHLNSVLFQGPVHAVWQRQEPLHRGQKGCGRQEHRPSYQNHHDSLHPVHSLCAVSHASMSRVS